MNIVLRDFREFEPELEFRGFIYDGKLTALTQYNDAIYFPRLQQQYFHLFVQPQC